MKVNEIWCDTSGNIAIVTKIINGSVTLQSNKRSWVTFPDWILETFFTKIGTL
jgi:hypothetical protein